MALRRWGDTALTESQWEVGQDTQRPQLLHVPPTGVKPKSIEAGLGERMLRAGQRRKGIVDFTDCQSMGREQRGRLAGRKLREIRWRYKKGGS